jgi:hypothetical protein
VAADDITLKYFYPFQLRSSCLHKCAKNSIIDTEGDIMIIYMDCCCLNRPFDNQLQDKIRLESDAVIAILSRCADNEWQLVGSDALDYGGVG